MSKYKLTIEASKEAEIGKRDLHSELLEKTQRIIPLLPMTLIIGIFTQIMMLAKYNAIILFSWSQVVNDTVILLIPLSVIAAGIYNGQTDKNYTSTKKTMFLRFITTAILGVILSILAIAIFPVFGAIPIFLLGMYLSGLLYYHIMNGPVPEPAELNKRNFIRPIAMYLCILLMFGMLYLGLDKYYSIFTQNAYVVLKDGKEEKVQYLNDKYIIYGTGVILPRTDKITFTSRNSNFNK